VVSFCFHHHTHRAGGQNNNERGAITADPSGNARVNRLPCVTTFTVMYSNRDHKAYKGFVLTKCEYTSV